MLTDRLGLWQATSDTYSQLDDTPDWLQTFCEDVVKPACVLFACNIYSFLILAATRFHTSFPALHDALHAKCFIERVDPVSRSPSPPLPLSNLESRPVAGPSRQRSSSSASTSLDLPPRRIPSEQPRDRRNIPRSNSVLSTSSNTNNRHEVTMRRSISIQRNDTGPSRNLNPNPKGKGKESQEPSNPFLVAPRASARSSLCTLHFHIYDSPLVVLTGSCLSPSTKSYSSWVGPLPSYHICSGYTRKVIHTSDVHS